ncbi:zf-HC2 domain-containing protein [Actinoplanes derwentensis]|uniref:zf-HC2 domain-containing protein n=1 Tax=Actinoplanes derwentensis TaxID=113562 RepID=UPI0018D44DAD|nr:zf-HC2 domain-containing protein [Actinoplanes derwentensis]GID86559.1 hypothetical protein Ade03nite_54830 [Actinoplanes derwentensis]
MQDLLGFLALGRLGPDDTEVAEAHLAQCAACRGQAADLRRTASALDLLSVVDIAELLATSTAEAAPALRPVAAGRAVCRFTGPGPHRGGNQVRRDLPVRRTGQATNATRDNTPT